VAFFSAGAINVQSYSYLDLSESHIKQNSAPENSAVEVLQSSMTKNLTFTNVNFESNKAIKNTVSLMYANAVFNNSVFYKNKATYQTKNLFVGYSQVVIEGSEFRSVL